MLSNEEASLDSAPGNIEPDKRFWGPWATAGFGCLIGAVIFIAQFLVVIVYTVVKVATEPPADIFEFTEALANDGLLIGLAGLLSALAGIGLIAVIIKIKKGFSISEYLGFRAIPVRTIPLAVPIAAGFIFIAYLVSFVPGKSDNAYIIEAYNSSVWPAIFWLEVVIFAPALEEIFFRGFLFVGFRQSGLKVAGTIILTSFVWTLLHIAQYDFYDLAALFVFGIILGLARQKTDSLWSPLILHSVYNLLVMILVAFSANSAV